MRSKIKTAIYLFAGFIALSFFQNCGYIGKSDPERFMNQGSLGSNGVPTYDQLYTNIFSPKCMSCHAGISPNFANYNDLMSSGAVVPSQPDSSRLYMRVNSGEMPQGGPELSSAEKRAIFAWIEAGALNGAPLPDLAPDVPSAFAATAGSTSSIILSWTLPAQTVTGVQVTRSLNSNGPYAIVANLTGAQSTYTDTGLVAATTYYYQLILSNSVGNSPASDTASATTSQPSPTVPLAPSDLSAAAVSASQINLSWTDNSSNETGFKIERGPGINGPFMEIAVTPADTTTYSDTGLDASTKYYYRISATNAMGTSPVTPLVNATTSAPAPTAPSAPTDLLASSSSSSQINLSWKDNSSNETGFKIERATTLNGNYMLVTTTAANVTTYQNTGLAASTSYFYRVSATNAVGTSAVAGPVSATTQAPPAPNTPAEPSAFTATATSMTQINLSWADNSNNETGFKIERSTTISGQYALVTTTAANITSYSNTGLTASTTYYYRLTAVNASGSSNYMSVSATTQSPAPTTPTAPSAFTATATSTTQINLAWTDNSNNETGFKIERSTTSNGTYALVTTTAAGATSYSNTGLAASTAYYYRLSAVNAAGSSSVASASATTQAAAPTIPTAPSAFTATATSTTQINLAWTDNSNNETGFKIERSTTSNGTFALVTTTAAGATSYSNTGLVASTTYYYRVSAVNAAGTSSVASASATTQGTATNPNATYTWIAANVTPKCTSCHGSGRTAGYDFRTYSGVMSAVRAGNSGSSKFYTETNSGSMPRGGSKLSAEALTNIKNWIDSGALNN